MDFKESLVEFMARPLPSCTGSFAWLAVIVGVVCAYSFCQFYPLRSKMVEKKRLISYGRRKKERSFTFVQEASNNSGLGRNKARDEKKIYIYIFKNGGRRGPCSSGFAAVARQLDTSVRPERRHLSKRLSRENKKNAVVIKPGNEKQISFMNWGWSGPTYVHPGLLPERYHSESVFVLSADTCRIAHNLN